MVKAIKLSPIEPGSLDELKVDRQKEKLRSRTDLLRGPEDQEDVEQAKIHLKNLVAYHEKGNALVSLLGYLNGDYSPEKLEDLWPLVYKLADPVIKDLNDKLLGMTDTDEFLAIVSNQILHLCSVDGSPNDHVKTKWARRMKEIALNFKGGMAVYKGDYSEISDGAMSFKGRVASLNHYVNMLYVGFILEKIKLELESTSPNDKKIHLLASTAFEYGATAEEISEYIGCEWNADDYRKYDTRGVRLNFGVGEWPEAKAKNGKLSMKELTMGLMFSEFNANHVRYRQELTTTEQERVQGIIQYRKGFDALIRRFTRMAVDQSLPYRSVLFDFEQGRTPVFLNPDLESAFLRGSLDADFGSIPEETRLYLKSFFKAEAMLANGELDGVKERRRFNDSSFADSMAYYTVDLLRSSVAMESLYQDVIRHPDSPDAALFNDVLAKTGSYLQPDVVDAIRKKKLSKAFPGCRPWTYHVVERFYRVINVLDILKPFMAQDVDGYGDYQELLYARVAKARELIEADDSDLAEMKAIQAELVTYAQVSPKDQVLHEERGELDVIEDNIAMTQLGFLNAILKKDSRDELKEGVGVLEVDLIGFGAKNFQSLATTAMHVIGTINDLGPEVRNAINTQHSVPTAQVISKAISKHPRLKRKLWEQLIAVADATANQDLRDVVEVLNSNSAVIPFSIDVDGGDEIRVAVDLEELENDDNWGDLKRIANQFRLRVVPFLGLQTLDDYAYARVKVEERFADLKTRETGGAPAPDNFCPVELA